MTKIIAGIVALLVFGLVGNVQAIPILGHVDLGAGYNPSTTTTGTAVFTFANINDNNSLTNFSLNGLSLTFEGDVFNLGNTGIIPGSLSSGWTVLGTVPGGTFELEFVGGPGIPEGGEVTFAANYTLLGPANILPWSEGGAWELGFGSTGILAIGPMNLPIFTGGSTSPAPEPTSLLLLGSGLAGLGLLGRRRFRKHSQQS
jgi:PEP-CTERM motif-containing protein